ncbi:hypothetical protein F3170_17360 [Escherichia coli]|nr:hypothetical protein [Escherichia coli]
MAATRPDIELQPTVNVKTTKALQTGCVHIEQMPEWTDRKMEGEYKRGEKFHVLWSLMNRHDGGSVWVEA